MEMLAGKIISALFSHGTDSTNIIYTTAQKQRVTFIEDYQHHRSQLHIKIFEIWGLRVVISENMLNSMHVPLHLHTRGGTWAQIPQEPDGIWTLQEFHADVVSVKGMMISRPSVTWPALVPSIKVAYRLLSAFSPHGNPWPFLPWLEGFACLSGPSPRLNLLLLITWKCLSDLSCLFISSYF